VTPTNATLHGTVNPESFDATYRFEYSADTGFASSTPAAVRAAADGAGEVTTTVTGLTPETEYRFRLTATTGDGTVTTDSGTFTTSAVPTPPPPPPQSPPRGPQRQQ
jgi:phosphodiesterase/alkaline phosphatase D-like protein